MDKTKLEAIGQEVPSHLGISTVSKLSAIIGHDLVGKLIPWRVNVIYNPEDIVYYKAELTGANNANYTTIKMVIPRQIGALNKVDLTNPSKCTPINTLDQLLRDGGKLRDEDKQAILREVDAKFTTKKYIVVSANKPTNPECQLWIKPIKTQQVYVHNSFL